MADVVFPPGCKPITEDLGPDELIRRLKALTHSLTTMGQEEGVYQAYIPLALLLTDEYFLQHPSKDVQLLIGCCIADILRVYAPEAPYKDADHVKTIFEFLIKQLNGLKDPKDPAFKRYFYLLETLAFVKSFNMCFDLEDSQEVFCQLFDLMFKIVSDDHSPKVKQFMLEVLSPLVTESDNVSNELLDLILINLVEPVKSSRKNTYNLAKQIVGKTSDTLEQYIQQRFSGILMSESRDNTLAIAPKVYEIIYELNLISPNVITKVLPQLEMKLKSGNESDRLKVVALLGRMFSEKSSTLANNHKQLWEQFLNRFCDISVAIRVKCVQSTMHFLLNHPDLRHRIIATLKFRQHDSDETVRYEVVMAIVETAKRDFQVVSESEDLLEYVKERTLDKKFKIRKEAMNGLAMIYKNYLSDSDVPEATKKAITWIKDKILHGYYTSSIEDKLLVERLLITCLVPYKLDTEERMKKLYQLLGTIDDNAIRAFIELQKNQLKIRMNVSEWIALHRQEMTARNQKEIFNKCGTISKQLPEPVKAQEFLMKFSSHLRRDETVLADMEIISKKDVTCKECADTMSILLKKLGQPIMTNLYYNTVKMLLERIASVMVDKESIEVLVRLIHECMEGGEVINELSLPPDSVAERGLKLLSVLAYVFSAYFHHETILRLMLDLLKFDDEYVPIYVLKSFTFLGRYKQLNVSHSDIINELAPICRRLAISGTPKQAKHAVRCIYVNTESSEVGSYIDIFSDIVDSFKLTLRPEHSKYRTAIVCLGHIAYNLPERFTQQIKNIIAKRIVKECLVKETDEDRSHVDNAWCNEEELSELIKCKIEALKTMARWLMGLKQDVLSAQKTFRMLNAFIKQNGDILETKRLAPEEMSWLRLSAAKSMLKICEQKGVGDQYSAEQFYHLSQLMCDPVPEVREIFAKKLHKGLNRGVLARSLPHDFMGFYALGGKETEPKLQSKLKSYIDLDINRRREYIKTITNEQALNQLQHIQPEYMLVFAVSVLTHDPEFVKYDDAIQLKKIESCLWFILEPLVAKKEYFSFSFVKLLITRMKNHKDACFPDDKSVNYKMWAICDLAMHVIYTRSTNYDTRECTAEARIPSMYFQAQESSFENDEIYISSDLFQATSISKKMGIVLPVTRKQRATLDDDRNASSSNPMSEAAVEGQRGNNEIEENKETEQEAENSNPSLAKRRREGTAE